MSKIKIDLLSSACQSLVQDSSSKFWGLLCVLSAIEGTAKIKAGVTYRINTVKLSKNLERLFYFGDNIKSFSDSSNYVTFSSKWVKKACDIFTHNSVSIKDAALFFNIEKEVDEGSDISSIVEKFITEIKLSPDDVANLFDTQYDNERDIVENGDYTKNTLWLKIKSRLNLNTSNTTLTMESPYTVVSHPAELSRAPFIQTLYAAQSNFECLLLTKFDFNELYKRNKTEVDKDKRTTSLSKQKIYYGAPGTGKSHTIKEDTADSDNKITTTFHPDTDYASFVGCYKPQVDDDGKTITYKFTPQAFANAYVNAWKLLLSGKVDVMTANNEERYRSWLPENGVARAFRYYVRNIKNNVDITKYEDVGNIFDISDPALIDDIISEQYPDSNSEKADRHMRAHLNKYKAFLQDINTNPIKVSEDKNFYLIIEEINRGNCAQIFGDLFQLLDRNEDGYSEYVIDVDKDFAEHITGELASIKEYKQHICDLAGINIDKFTFSKIALPCNLSILATMNTSDQSLFPMDSAFKRRWDWEYIPINTQKEEIKDAKINIGDNQYSWSDFLNKVNLCIYDVNKSEDKQLGQFFATKGGDIDFDQFRSKVMFYLWFEIFKDEESKSIFKTTIGADEKSTLKSFTFGDLFKDNGEALLQDFMEQLKVTFTTISPSHITSDEIESLNTPTEGEQ